VLLGAVAWALGGIERRVVESGFQGIQTNRLKLHADNTWLDPRWEGELATTVARVGVVDASDPSARRAVVGEIESLSFIASVGRPEVVWPDGLRVAVRFHSPVACISVGGSYLPVAANGTVLSGGWDAPPQVGPGWLPVLGPLDGTLDRVLPGDVLQREDLLDGLAIAVSMWIHLSPDDLGQLGRVRIDATYARETGPDQPGARIYLERGREVGFGRSPRQDEPGSLPPEAKWANLSRALEYLRTGVERADWEWLDLRWDRAELRAFVSSDKNVVDEED
jgi:hypothetical protein